MQTLRSPLPFAIPALSHTGYPLGGVSGPIPGNWEEMIATVSVKRGTQEEATVFDYASRRARARIRMQQEGMDAMLLFLSSNLLYLAGWTDNPGERFLGALITSERETM